jgi:uncharacterized protein DUF6941
MDVSLALLADYANVTAEGKLNILGIFQAIAPARFPHAHAQMHLVLSLEADQAESGTKKKIEIRFRDADGKTFFNLGAEMEIPRPPKPVAGPITMNHILQLNGIRFERPGDYEFVVLINDEVKKTITVRAIQRAQPGTQG